MKQSDNPETLARFKLIKNDGDVILRGVDDEGDPFQLTLNQLLATEIVTDLTHWLTHG